MSKAKQSGNNEIWRLHDTYLPGTSCSRVVTRSQTGFNRIKNSPSDLDLFADPNKHQPPGMPHLMVILKGEYGSVPRTLLTRSTGQYFEVSKELCQAVDEYKKEQPVDATAPEQKEDPESEKKEDPESGKKEE